MVNPYDVTKYTRTKEELEEFLLFCVSVAGKKATWQAQCLNNFLNYSEDNLSPFEIIRNYINSKKLRDTLGKNAYNMAKKYDSKKTTKEIINILEQCK